ncbi:9434_t:CDS:2, partial [Rhizophagus irregularis]
GQFFRFREEGSSASKVDIGRPVFRIPLMWILVRIKAAIKSVSWRRDISFRCLVFGRFGIQWISPFWAYGLHNVWIALGLFFCKSATWNLWTFFSFRDEISAPSGIDLELE